MQSYRQFHSDAFFQPFYPRVVQQPTNKLAQPIPLTLNERISQQCCVGILTPMTEYQVIGPNNFIRCVPERQFHLIKNSGRDHYATLDINEANIQIVSEHTRGFRRFKEKQQKPEHFEAKVNELQALKTEICEVSERLGILLSANNCFDVLRELERKIQNQTRRLDFLKTQIGQVCGVDRYLDDEAFVQQITTKWQANK